MESFLQVESNATQTGEDGWTHTYAPPQPPSIVIYGAASNILYWIVHVETHTWNAETFE